MGLSILYQWLWETLYHIVWKLRIGPFFDIFDWFLNTQKVNIARFARNSNETLSMIFKHRVLGEMEFLDVLYTENFAVHTAVPP